MHLQKIGAMCRKILHYKQRRQSRLISFPNRAEKNCYQARDVRRSPVDSEKLDRLRGICICGMTRRRRQEHYDTFDREKSQLLIPVARARTVIVTFLTLEASGQQTEKVAGSRDFLCTWPPVTSCAAPRYLLISLHEDRKVSRPMYHRDPC